jgi:hypothetical protein
MSIVRVTRLVLGISVVFLAWACNSPQRSAAPNTGTARDSAEQVMFGARSVLASNGLRRGEIGGDTVMSFDALTRFEFRGFRAQFTTTLGRPLSSLTAPSGTYHVNRAVVDAHGRVAITSDTTRRRIDGVAVRYDVSTNRLTSDSPFVAMSGTRKLSGIGFTTDPGLFTVKCLQRCTGALGP